MVPTLEHNDYILIKTLTTCEDVKENLGGVVFAEKGQRRLIKRLTDIKSDKNSSEISCWLESDASLGERKYYDSNIFGYVPCTSIKGKFLNSILDSRLACKSFKSLHTETRNT